ncbi:type I-C CRISPR-associated protein Cas8c/Csd1 [Sodaliphilus sp.]|uniref:type I-C CRISPR-associated protein Cas8c/Csd1 n=1 Tax=Sodaliphilus sp. TaxID=2815818 RepID=UPI003890A076
MILKALYDYYNRCDNMPAYGMEEKQIGFLLVIDHSGKFLRFEDCRIDKDTAKTFLVKKMIGRTSAVAPNYLYDNSSYVFGYSTKENGKEQQCFDAFKAEVESIAQQFPENDDLKALCLFYEKSRDEILNELERDTLWSEVIKNLGKKFSFFSFRIEGDTKIIAQKREILQLEVPVSSGDGTSICLVSGIKGVPVETTTATMVPGSQATAKLVSFQVSSGYDSYGKKKGYNAPISEAAEFAYTTALNTLLSKNSRNKFSVGTRTFVFWASSSERAALQAEDALFSMLGFVENTDNPNANIENVRKVFNGIYSGSIKTSLDDKFYILGLAPNAARIAVAYWSETTLRDFAGMILQHFDDMEVIDTRKEKRPYMGLRDILGAVTLSKKHTDATPNLPDAVVKSIFQGLPYPYTLFASAIRRIRAEQEVSFYGGPCRVAIIKAYLNRLNDTNNKKLDIMLDKENTNQGYLCGRLFATLEKIQEDANHMSTIRERYMNAASATPAAVFATLLNLSSHHSEKLNAGAKIYYEKIKQEIIDKIMSDGFPAHLDLQDQGRFFVGYYHQRQDFFTSKNVNNEQE